MNKFYKGKYIIAIYDENDYLVDVFCNAQEAKKKYKEVYCGLNKAKNRGTKNIYFIDVLEKHNDIFSEEDEIFLKEMKEELKNKTEKLKEECEKLGISVRTYYKRKADKNKKIN